MTIRSKTTPITRSKADREKIKTAAKRRTTTPSPALLPAHDDQRDPSPEPDAPAAPAAVKGKLGAVIALLERKDGARWRR